MEDIIRTIYRKYPLFFDGIRVHDPQQSLNINSWNYPSQVREWIVYLYIRKLIQEKQKHRRRLAWICIPQSLTTGFNWKFEEMAFVFNKLVLTHKYQSSRSKTKVLNQENAFTSLSNSTDFANGSISQATRLASKVGTSSQVGENWNNDFSPSRRVAVIAFPSTLGGKP